MNTENRPIRVLHCLWSGEIGGMERAVTYLVRSQERDPNVAPALLFARGRGPYYELASNLDCPVYDLNLPHGHALNRLGHISEIMRRFDIVHFHSVEPLLMLASLRNPKSRRLYTHRGGPLPRGSTKRLIEYEIAGLMMRRRFHGFSGNTKHAAACASSLFRLTRTVRVTYNGIDFSQLQPKRSATSMRNEFGTAKTDVLIGTAAHLRDWKRIDRLITALARIDEPWLRLVVAGDGPDRARLEAQTYELGLCDRVLFVGSHENIGDVLQILDAFALPSSSRESFGNAVVEAMAMGLPAVVCADGGGLTEHVDDGKSGFVVADQMGLENSLRALSTNPALRRRLGNRARRVIRERYSLERSAADYRDFYAAALESA